MPFDHNEHYHRLLLRQVPTRPGAALDVGCGTGGFARRLARLGREVDAVDPSRRVIARARALSGQDADGSSAAPGSPRFLHADVRERELPQGHYAFISCLASIHHMPFETVVTLRRALAPGGVLAILGCYREKTWGDWACACVASPTNAVARLSVAAGERLSPSRARSARARMKPPVTTPLASLPEIRQESAALLPGRTVRRLLFWRYLLVFRNTPEGGAR